MVCAGIWGCDRAVDHVPLWPDGVSPGPGSDARLPPGSDASVHLPDPRPQPVTEASIHLPDPRPQPVKPPPYDSGVVLKTCGDATNAKGTWTNQLLNLTSSCQGLVTPLQAAITSDSQGRAHVALTGTMSPGNKGVLLVGSNRKGYWTFKVVDKDATGAVAIAARYGVTFVGYFGSTSFRVARVCD